MRKAKFLTVTIAAILTLAPAAVHSDTAPPPVVPIHTSPPVVPWLIFAWAGGIITAALVANFQQNRQLTLAEAASGGLLFWFTPAKMIYEELLLYPIPEACKGKFAGQLCDCVLKQTDARCQSSRRPFGFREWGPERLTAAQRQQCYKLCAASSRVCRGWVPGQLYCQTIPGNWDLSWYPYPIR